MNLSRVLPLILASVAIVLVTLVPLPARAFGDIGGFDPRVLLTGTATDAAHPSAGGRWSWELVQRTSAPAKLKPTVVRADASEVTHAPFLFWSGTSTVQPLTSAEIGGLHRFFALGGVMLVDDAGVTISGDPSEFGRSAKKELLRVLPESVPIELTSDHVLFRSFYLLTRAEGRVLGKKTLEGIVRGGATQVIFSSHDIGGALARGPTGIWEEPAVPGGDGQREHAIRLAINIAMYVLCSNYKDDQVHAPFLMRRRALVGNDTP